MRKIIFALALAALIVAACTGKTIQKGGRSPGSCRN